MAGRLGAVEEYAISRLSPEPGRLVTCSAIFDDYRNWCEQAGLAPLREAEFTGVFKVIAPFGGAEEMVKDLKAKVFPDREVKFLSFGPDAKPAVRSV